MVQKGRRQIIIKILCIIAATILWLYTSNDENTSTTYRISNISIEVINQDYLMQSGLTLLPGQNFSTSLRITGKPTDIYSVKADQFKIVADLSVYALRKGDNRIPITIVKRPGVDISIINDNNMWISVEVDNYIEKTIPVQVITKGNVKNGFYGEKPVVKPESVVISGAEQYVSTVAQVLTEVDLNNLDKSSTFTSTLKAADKAGREIEDVKVSPAVAEITLPIQMVKEVGINIKTTGNVPEDRVLKSINLSKDKIKITGDTNILNGINSIDTEAIDLSKIQEDKSSITTRLVLPSNIKLVEVDNIITLEVILDRIIEKNLTFNIKTLKLQEGLNAKLETTSVVVLISGGKDLINELENNALEANVNLDTLGTGEYNLPVVINLPKGLTIISQSPKNIKVIIEEKTSGTSNGSSQ